MEFATKWDQTSEHFYETGVSRGVLYVLDPTKKANAFGNKYGDATAWNGLTSVSESPEGAEVTALYADNIKYLNLQSAEDFKGTIEAYTYPDEFGVCDGSATLGVAGIKVGQQARRVFGLCYRTEVGTDEAAAGTGNNYKLHLVYNCLASPSERSYETINDSPEAITFSWEFSTTPVTVSDFGTEKFKPTATVTIDMWRLTTAQVEALENALYGTVVEGESPQSDPVVTPGRLLLPDEIVDLLNLTPEVTPGE